MSKFNRTTAFALFSSLLTASIETPASPYRMVAQHDDDVKELISHNLIVAAPNVEADINGQIPVAVPAGITEATFNTAFGETQAWAAPAAPAAPTPVEASHAERPSFAIEAVPLPSRAPRKVAATTLYPFAELAQAAAAQPAGAVPLAFHVPNKEPKNISSSVSGANYRLREQGVYNVKFQAYKADANSPHGEGVYVYALPVAQAEQDAARVAHEQDKATKANKAAQKDEDGTTDPTLA